jgi:hypothetical protein
VTEKVTLNFRERHKPVIVLEFPNRKIELDPNLEVEDMGESCVWEEARARGQRLLTLMDLKDPQSVTVAKEVVNDALNLGRDYIGYLVERTKAGQKLPKLTGPEVDKIMDALSPRAESSEPFSEEVLGSIAQWLASGPAGADANGEPAVEASGEAGEGEPSVPLAPKKRSRSRSSSSRSRSKTAGSAGGRTGGSESPGGSSKATSSSSRQPAPV